MLFALYKLYYCITGLNRSMKRYKKFPQTYVQSAHASEVPRRRRASIAKILFTF